MDGTFGSVPADGPSGSRRRRARDVIPTLVEGRQAVVGREGPPDGDRFGCFSSSGPVGASAWGMGALRLALQIGFAALWIGASVGCGSSGAEASASLRETVLRANADAPRMIDEHTRFEEATVDGDGITYHFTLVNRSAAETAPHSLDDVLTRDVLERVCFDPVARPLLERGLGLRYVYRSSDAEPVASILVTRGRCGP